MPEIYLSPKIDLLEVSSFNGNSMGVETHKFSPSLSNSPRTIDTYNFFRQGDNCSYVGGEVAYVGTCRNNLIISSYKHNLVENVMNSFIFADNGQVTLFPISNIPTAIDLGKKALSNYRINYNLPLSVFERENLVNKDLESLMNSVKQIYGVHAEGISRETTARTRNGLFYLISHGEREYVLKFRGRNLQRAELLAQVTRSIPNYFPFNFCRQDNNLFTFRLGNELYGLEEFVKGSGRMSRNLDYFSLLGYHMGLLHNQFQGLFRSGIKKELMLSVGNRLSESNLVSFYLDLAIDKDSNEELLSVMGEVIKQNIGAQIKSSPIFLIHGDLNYSNLIWEGKIPKIVDSETLMSSFRLNEFESPLLFEGNMSTPSYLKGSLKSIEDSYNQSSNIPLNRDEVNILPFLLKYSFLRNFVIRKIRRGKILESPSPREIVKNIELIEEDSTR